MIRADHARRGAALIVVLLVLLALFALCAPFLWLASSVDDASARLVDRTKARLALDDAAVHARSTLAGTHPSIDPDRDFDSLEELSGEWPLDPALFDTLDERGVMWDHDVEDLSGRIDLSSCPPSVLANLLGIAGYLTQPLEPDAEEIRIAGGENLPDAGYLYVDGEFIAYDARRGGTLTELTRGLFHTGDETGCGPRASSSHGAGMPVLGLEAFVFAQWRQTRGMREARAMGFGELGEELRTLLPAPRDTGPENAEEAAAGPQLADDPLRDMAVVLDRTATLYGDVGAGSRWQQPVRILNPLVAGTSCLVEVENARWFSPGSTVRLVGTDGTSELAIVRGVRRARFVVLEEPVRGDYERQRGEIHVLARRPVNVNTASRDVLIALVENLSLAGRNERITGSEAERFADMLIERRPFEGFQDLLERLLLPAGGIVRAEPGQSDEAARGAYREETAAFLDVFDVVALYKNARNANDSDLSFSTMPFAFTSRDVFSIDLRASLNVPGLEERYSVAREQVELVAPPGELMHLFGRQEDFEEAVRLERAAPGWISGPTSVSVNDDRFGADPPPRSLAHLAISIDAQGGEAPVSRSIFPSDEPDGFVRPGVTRANEAGPRQGRVVHFDRSRSDLEGRDLSQDLYRPDPSQAPAFWTAGNDLFGPAGVALWLKPESLANGHVFDAGTGNPDNDRVRAFFENDELIVEVLDAVGDHPDTEFEERSRLRLPLAGSGVQAGVWSRFDFDVRSNRPDHMTLRVDGMGYGRPQSVTAVEVRGRTFLTGELSADDTTIPVESTEDFPERCTLLIGNEVIEAVKAGPNSFTCEHEVTGEFAGYGGRLARELFEWRGSGSGLELLNRSLATKPGTYPVGTAVQLWGYSTALASDVPPGGGELDGDIGPFSVARVVGVDGDRGVPIAFELDFGAIAGPFEIEIGRGFDVGEAPPDVLNLAAADPNQSASEAMRGFSSSGGYAVLMQAYRTFVVGPFGGNPGEEVDEPRTPFGTRLFGMQVIRYGGVDGTSLTSIDWSVDDSQIPSVAGRYPIIGELGVPSAYLIEYGGRLADPDRLNESLAAQLVVVPISLPCGANPVDFLPPTPLFGAEFDFASATVDELEVARFAQLTRTDDAELTEWLRYDFIVNGEFVRAAPSALVGLYTALTRGEVRDVDIGQPGGGGGGGGGFPIQPGSGTEPTALPIASARAAAPAPATPFEPAATFTEASTALPPGPYWQPTLGEDELDELILTRALSDALQFRGVLDTFSHAHPSGTEVLPVFDVGDRRLESTDGGWLGRDDPVFLVSDDLGDIGQAAKVHRAWRPVTFDFDNTADWPAFVQRGWEAGANLTAVATGRGPSPIWGIENWSGRQLVALDRPIGIPYLADPSPNQLADMRERYRVTKFPSGELPRILGGLVIGSEQSGGDRIDAVVDEIEFHTGQRIGNEGFSMVLAEEVDDEQTTIRVTNVARMTWDVVGFGNRSILDSLPEDGGLLQIGRELLAYQSYDSTTNELEIAENGRGLLGTDASAHAAWESVVFHSHVAVSTLAAGIGPDDEFLDLVGGGGNRTGADDFGDVGTVLVGDELIHHTYREGDLLAMPRVSTAPGRNDFDGGGAFRGRFGTLPGSWPAGTAVVRFPVRYPDRWVSEADLPELHHMTLELSQPDAFLTGLFFETDPALVNTVRLGMLQRVDETVPWDADPYATPGLELVYDADPKDGPLEQGQQIDRAQWRVFVEYLPGAFDPVEGLATGWKQAPALLSLGALYFAPGRVIARRER